jgi:hypothetical protein
MYADSIVTSIDSLSTDNNTFDSIYINGKGYEPIIEVKYDSSNIALKQPTTQKEKEIFSDPKLNYKQKYEQTPGLLDRFWEWLLEKLFGKATFNDRINAERMVYWLIVITALVIMILLLRKSELVSLIKPKGKGMAFNFNDITEDLNTIDFDARIKAAESENDYRTAIRWHYLKALFILDKKQFIAFANHKTNFDYLYELKTPAYQNGFKEISKIYEYLWYGEFEANEEKYKNYVSDFTTFLNQVNV